MKRASRSLIVGLFLSLEFFAASAIHAQSSLLQVTSPVAGSIATGAQTITILVSADSSVQNVGVIVQSGLPDVQSTGTANQFSLTIPTTIPAGMYQLMAVGIASGAVVQSAPIAIDVEPQYNPLSIDTEPNLLTFLTIGNQHFLRGDQAFAQFR